MGNTPKDFIADNEEYVKLRDGSTDDTTPRETPAGQAPGKRGYARPDLDTWTTRELEQHAAELGIDGAEHSSREALIEALESRWPPKHRAG